MAKTTTAYVDSGRLLLQHMYSICTLASVDLPLIGYGMYIYDGSRMGAGVVTDAGHLVPFPYHGSHTHLWCVIRC